MEKIKTALESAWSKETSFLPDEWTERNPARGQCAVTALVVQDYLGGDIIKCDVVGDECTHFYNSVRGEVFDFSRAQFKEGVQFCRKEVKNREDVLDYPNTCQRYEKLKEEVAKIVETT